MQIPIISASFDYCKPLIGGFFPPEKLTLSRPSDVNYVLDKSAQSTVLCNIRFRKNLFLENRHETPAVLLVLVLAESFYTTWHLNWIALGLRNSSLTTPPAPPSPTFPLSRGHFCLSGDAQDLFFLSILYVLYKSIYVLNGNFLSFSIKTISASYL